MNHRRIMLIELVFCLSLTANAQLSGPGGLVFDSSGNLWVANWGPNQVLELNPKTGVILNTITDGVNGPSRLQLVGVDLWVLNTTGNNITVYTDLGSPGAKLVQTISTGSEIEFSLGAAVDAYGDLYISGVNSHNIVAYNIDGGLVETLVTDKQKFSYYAPGVMVIYGQDIYVGFGPNVGENAVIAYNVGEFLTGDPEEKALYNNNVDTGPTGIAFDSKGNIYIAEYTSNTAIVYSPDGEGLLEINPGGPGGATQLVNGPEGIAVDSRGHIYVSNSNNNDIAVFEGLNGKRPGKLLYNLY
jgi:sugar lactone lactonase YvrE